MARAMQITGIFEYAALEHLLVKDLKLVEFLAIEKARLLAAMEDWSLKTKPLAEKADVWR
jgi:hypothetical protein